MTDQLTKALVISGIALFGLLLWALSIALVLRDVNRRHLPGYEQTAWIVLAAAIPLIGGAAYLFARMLDRIFSPRASKAPELEGRLTAYKPEDKPATHLPTVAAADLIRMPAEKSGQTHTEDISGQPPNLLLEIIAGPLAGRKFTIKTLPARIGRGSLVALNLEEDGGISRHHAEIYEKHGVLRVRDLQSMHGTYLNGKKIMDESLNPGDHLSLGQSTLSVRMEEQDGNA